MLSIKFGKDSYISELNLYINQRFDSELLNHSVDNIQADGDELHKILMSVDNIPNTHCRVQRWYGDLAKTILYSWNQINNL